MRHGNVARSEVAASSVQIDKLAAQKLTLLRHARDFVPGGKVRVPAMDMQSNRNLEPYAPPGGARSRPAHADAGGAQTCWTHGS